MKFLTDEYKATHIRKKPKAILHKECWTWSSILAFRNEILVSNIQFYQKVRSVTNSNQSECQELSVKDQGSEQNICHYMD